MFLPPPTYHEPDEPTTGSERPSKYAVLFGILACSNLWRVVDTLPMTNLWSIPALLIVAKAVLGAAAWVYIWMFTDLFIWPAFVTWWNSGDPKSEQPAKSAPQAPQQPKREPTPVPAPQINTRLNGGGNGEAVEVESSAIFTHWINNHVIAVDGTTADLRDYNLTRQRWNEIALARRRGELGTISANALYESSLRVPNRGDDSEADRIIEMMLDLGLIVDGGDRRPYVFTSLGDLILPHPHSEVMF